jgi:hypothetical protein
MGHAFHRKRGKFKPAGRLCGAARDTGKKSRCCRGVAVQSQSLPRPAFSSESPPRTCCGVDAGSREENASK